MSTSSPNIDIIDVYMRASAQAESLARSIPDLQFHFATPCSEWDIRALCNHIYAGEIIVTTRILRLPQPDPKSTEDRLGDDPKGRITHAFNELRYLLAKQDALDHTVVTSRDGVTHNRDLAGLVSRRIADLVVHNWDLSKALGRSTADFDPELVSWTLAHFQDRFDGYDRTQMPIIASVADERPSSDDAIDADRLAAYMGRDVDFTPHVFGADNP